MPLNTTMKDTLVIIIDMWQKPPKYSSSEFPLALHIEEMLSRPTVGAAILASYESTNELFSNNLWYNNRSTMIPDNIRNTSTGYYLTMFTGANTTHSRILNYKNENIDQLALFSVRELNYYLENINQNISKIFLVGQAWDECIKDKPLGFENLHRKLSRKRQYEIFVDNKCVIDIRGIPPCIDDPAWHQQSESVYKYIP